MLQVFSVASPTGYSDINPHGILTGTAYLLNCWVLHPVARVSTNVFLKTTVRNNVSVLDIIVH
jgi:hypothetical protein